MKSEIIREEISIIKKIEFLVGSCPRFAAWIGGCPYSNVNCVKCWLNHEPEEYIERKYLEVTKIHTSDSEFCPVCGELAARGYGNPTIYYCSFRHRWKKG